MELARLFEQLEPISPGQEKLREALLGDAEIVGVFGPTGTGKSLFTIAYGLSMVAKGSFKRFVVSRPIIDVATGREVTVTSNPEAYSKLAFDYVRDVVSSFVDEDNIRGLVDEGKVVFVDPHLLRGRSFDDSVILLDDAQNAPVETIVEIITRLGRNSKLIIAGDPVFQRDPERQGLSLAREILINEENVEVVDLGVKDVVRPGARRGLRLLLELQVRKRQMSEVERMVYEAAKQHAPDADILTVVYLVDYKRKWGIESEHVPDALIVVKEGHMGRTIGQGGERITSVEEETGLTLRVVELTLNFREYVRAIHPVSWIHKHVVDFDFAGPQLRLVVAKGNVGPIVGQKGVYVKFIDEVFRDLFGFGVYVVEEKTGRRKRRR